MYNRYGSKVLGSAEDVGTISGVRSRFCGGVAADSPSESAWSGLGVPGVGTPLPLYRIVSDILGLLP